MTTTPTTPDLRSAPRYASTNPVVKLVKRVPSTITILVLVLLTAYPLFWMVINSLKGKSDFLDNPSYALPEVWVWENYTKAWEVGNLATTITNSVIVTIPSLILIVILGTAAGFALEVMVFKRRGGVLLYVLAGIMIPGQMIILPLFTTFYNVGLVGSLTPLIIIYTAGGLPLTIFMMATYFRAIPKEVFEAAAIDGASIYRIFTSIAFPMVRNAIFTVALVQFFFIWNDLLISLTFTSGGQWQTIQVGLLAFTGQYGSVEFGPTFAAICINVVGILVLYIFLNQRVMKGLTAGSVKG